MLNPDHKTKCQKKSYVLKLFKIGFHPKKKYEFLYPSSEVAFLNFPLLKVLPIHTVLCRSVYHCVSQHCVTTATRVRK